ncbi:MAG: lipid-A-disaccharide synthase [Alphaproteobacteria bacterium]
MAKNNKKHIYIIAGEASGDLLGAEILKNFKKDEVKISGIGGERMSEFGLKSLFDYNDLAVMGAVDILTRYNFLKSRIQMTIDDIKQKKPDIVITIDAQSFSSRIAQGIQDLDSHKMQVVAPSVWASRKRRAKLYARLFDSIMCIFPFEQKLFKGVKTYFVGHPACDKKPDKPKIDLRKKYNVNKNDKLIALLAGSRSGEIKYCLDMYIKAIKKLGSNIHVFAPVVKNQKDKIKEELEKSGLKYNIIEQDEKNDALQHCDCAIATIGTVTLELAILGVPMVVAYNTSIISELIMRLFYYPPYASLPNIVLGHKKIVPEFVRDKANPTKIANAVNKILSSGGVEQKKEFKKIFKLLKSPDGEYGKSIYKKIKDIIKI